MKRLLTLIVLAAATALAVTLAAGTTGAASSGGGKRIAVFERATTDTPVDLPAGGDSLGDTLTFANEVFDARTGQKVGTDQGQCVRTVVGEAFECSWTTFLPQGQITVQGPFYDAADSTLRSRAARARTETPAARWTSTRERDRVRLRLPRDRVVGPSGPGLAGPALLEEGPDSFQGSLLVGMS